MTAWWQRAALIAESVHLLYDFDVFFIFMTEKTDFT